MKTQYILEIIAVGFFAISGSLAASERSKPDWFGVTIIGFITSLGGGTTRDVLLGCYPLVWVKDINFIYAIILGIILASLFYTPLLKLRKAFFLFDTIGIAMSTVLGTEKALQFGVHPLVAAIMGMFTAVMGGVLRDVLINETPILFRKEIYASACLAGAALYLVLIQFNLDRLFCIITSMLLILIIRITAIKYNLTLPQFRKENIT